jgi:molybdopterin-guanine dinucleotide biosynthesis adapter protein
MKVIGIIGASALGKDPFVETLIAAFRLDGWSVSTIKRAPDGFDIDRPGKLSYARREAGCHEVMLVGDRRLVLMQEFRAAPVPSLGTLLARLDPVDLVIVEGFQDTAVPTIEVSVATSGRAPRWPQNRHVVALVTDEPVTAPLPTFAVADIPGLAEFVVGHLALSRRA